MKGDARQREIQQHTQQYASLEPWARELDALHRKFEDHATRVKAAERDLAADHSSVNVASLQAATEGYVQDLKHFQNVSGTSTHA